MPKEVIENQGAKQRAADKESTASTASGHVVSTVFDSVETQTSIGADGAATALTAHPVGYILVTISGVIFKVPYYNL